MVRTVGNYLLYHTIGVGSYGRVKYAVNKKSGEEVAIKILDKETILKQNMAAQIKKEIAIMKSINHPNVVTIKEVFATSSKIFLVIEYVEGGELLDYLNKNSLREDEARYFFKQLVEGLLFCHNNGVCHRDLKPENLLLDGKGNLKISDFGLGTLYMGSEDDDSGERAKILHTTCGTPNYVCPEVLESEGYDGRKADVWSIGVVLYTLIAGYLPFEEETIAALFAKIKRACYSMPTFFSEDARDLISRILVVNPSDRISLEEVQHHVWMSGMMKAPIIRARISDVTSKVTKATTHADADAETKENHGGHKEKNKSGTVSSVSQQQHQRKHLRREPSSSKSRSNIKSGGDDKSGNPNPRKPLSPRNADESRCSQIYGHLPPPPPPQEVQGQGQGQGQERGGIVPVAAYSVPGHHSALYQEPHSPDLAHALEKAVSKAFIAADSTTIGTGTGADDSGSALVSFAARDVTIDDEGGSGDNTGAGAGKRSGAPLPTAYLDLSKLHTNPGIASAGVDVGEETKEHYRDQPRSSADDNVHSHSHVHSHRHSAKLDDIRSSEHSSHDASSSLSSSVSSSYPPSSSAAASQVQVQDSACAGCVVA